MQSVKKIPWSLNYVPDWFVTDEQLKIWRDDDKYCNAYGLIKWYGGYQKRKTQKAKIKEELMPNACHLSRWWGWCVPEDEKQRTKIIFFDHLICLD